MSFLVAFNGQFSPFQPNSNKSSGTIPGVGSVTSTSGVREFKEILDPLSENHTHLPNQKIVAYQEQAKKFQQNKKREHARDIMNPAVKVIQETALVSEAAQLMQKYGFRHLPVVNAQNLIVGMISDRELIGHSEKINCGEIMVRKVIVCDEFTSINEIAITLLNERINALPIINRNHEMTGIITQTDILNYVIKSTTFLSSA